MSREDCTAAEPEPGWYVSCTESDGETFIYGSFSGRSEAEAIEEYLSSLDNDSEE